MKPLLVLIKMTFAVSLLVSCTSKTPILPITPPTLTPTSKAQAIEEMIDPGEKVGDMVVMVGQDEKWIHIFEFCDPLNTGECGEVPVINNLFLGYGFITDTSLQMKTNLEKSSWQLFIDGQPVDLPAFGFIDLNLGRIYRFWNVMVDNVTPGKHTVQYLLDYEGNHYNMAWIFTTPLPATMEIPAGAESFTFAGSSEVFSTLAEFDSLLKSTIASVEVESFWAKVIATGKMPLIFGDSMAVFLFRGQAESVYCRGDFTAQYVRQGTTDIWSFMKKLEPEARLEYKIMVDSSDLRIDPLNPLSETGGLGSSSVVQMPEYRVSEYIQSRGNIPHGTMSDKFLIKSQVLNYFVNYQVYTPNGYDAMKDLPVVYVTDGQDYVNPKMGSMVNILDNLIADGKIKPIVVVFIDPRDPTVSSNRRERELVPESLDTCLFCDFIVKELVPAVDTSYRTDPSPDARAILGFSLGGMFSAYMGRVYPDVFHLIGIQSPYITREWIYDSYQQSERLPLKVFLSHGSYDVGAGSLRLREILEAKDYRLLFIQIPEGHSYGNVRDTLDDFLVYYFGVQ